MKKIFIIALTLAMAFAPVSMYAQAEREGIEVSVSGITLSISGGNVHIVGASGEVMEIFNLTGTKVATIRIDSADKTFALNLPKGCYLVKVGKIVRKISVQ
ncbi:MAG: T9SS type A sorting domain-containing protein [Bacteroidaceae bacterium]|nr:T9SS type A sorting domain-containing protein [Bacteroidaceae bacterium]